MERISSFNIIGIAINTSNADGKALMDLGTLWGRFFSENIAAQIPNAINHNIYALYTDYETNHTGKYTALIGLAVSDLDNIAPGLTAKSIASGNYLKYVARGKMPEAIVKTWEEIWQNDHLLNRKYTVDFERYDERSNNGDQSEVEVFIAVN